MSSSHGLTAVNGKIRADSRLSGTGTLRTSAVSEPAPPNAIVRCTAPCRKLKRMSCGESHSPGVQSPYLGFDASNTGGAGAVSLIDSASAQRFPSEHVNSFSSINLPLDQ